MTTALATIAQVKEFIGTADATDDALLTRLTTQAAESIERSAGRVFGTASYTETSNGTGADFLVLGNRPVTAVASVVIDGVTIPESTSSLVAGWLIASPWKIALRGSYAFTAGVQNVTIGYTAGYATIPADLTQACVLIAALLYKQRDRLGLSSKGVGGESIAFDTVEFPPSVQATINNHSNHYMP
jgi:uncharacterized phiE125 gp8 family phage protein